MLYVTTAKISNHIIMGCMERHWSLNDVRFLFCAKGSRYYEAQAMV